MNKMGQIISMALPIILTYQSQSRQQESNLKLEAQKVKEFTGSFEDWSKSKSHTECASDRSGYKLILTSRAFVDRNPCMNQVVYLQLVAATIKGISHHLIKQHKTAKD